MRGRPPLDYSNVDIDRLARTCVKQFAAIAKDSNVEFSLNFCEGDHKIPVDVIAIRRVLMNLLGNAVKFTSAGGGIVVSGHRLGRSYILEVEDTGSGIPEQELDLLFRRYSPDSGCEKMWLGHRVRSVSMPPIGRGTRRRDQLLEHRGRGVNL